MSVLITGATGFIGSHVTRLLVREGHTVFALIREGSDTSRIRDVLGSTNIIHGDLVHFESVEKELERIRPEICLHLAWYAVPGEYLVSEENLKMLTASINLASHLAELGCKKFIGTGTCLEYDTEIGYLSETSYTKPRSLYAATKLALYHVLTQLAAASGMRFAWARLFYLYGPWEDQRRLVPSVISSLLRNESAKLTKGDQVRDFLHVEDVASAIWALAQSDLSGPVNIGSGHPVTVREIAMQIGAVLNRQNLVELGVMPTSDSEPIFICANNSLLRNGTGWVPRHGLEEGLRDTVAWWKAHLDLNQISNTAERMAEKE